MGNILYLDLVGKKIKPSFSSAFFPSRLQFFMLLTYFIITFAHSITSKVTLLHLKLLFQLLKKF